MAVSEKTKSFWKKMGELVAPEENHPQLHMPSCIVTFLPKTEERNAMFRFQRYGAEKGVDCFRSETVRVAKLLPKMLDILAKTKEIYDDEPDKDKIEGAGHSEIIQKNPSFEKRLEIQIYNQNPFLSLTLYMMDTDDGNPSPCPGSIIFRDEDDPQQLLDFVEEHEPEKERKVYKKSYKKMKKN
jgi:hypothetical protein